MALQSARLRRALTSLSSIHRSLSSPATHSSPPIPRTFISSSPSVQSSASLLLQSRSFTGSRVSLFSSGKKYKLYKEGDEITEDTVLFEGCDFNHWLITVDFPTDPVPSPEEMVATYERICAQGLNISIEEAKQKIYACSTTTYNGFQAVMTEEESERFKDVPGVVFVLPDSYIDPQNKQYGGDKYENGVITPRPPPYQHKRSPGRFTDRNRAPNPPRFDQQRGPAPNQGGNPSYNQQGGRYYGPPQQGYPPQGGGNYGPQQSYPPQGGGNYGGAQQSYTPRQNHGPPGQGERMPMNNSNYQENRGGSYQGNFNQGHQGGYYPQDQRKFPQGAEGDFRQQAPNFSTGTQGQGVDTGYRQGYAAEGQSFSQTDQRNMDGENSPYPPPMGQTGTNPVRQ